MVTISLNAYKTPSNKGIMLAAIFGFTKFGFTKSKQVISDMMSQDLYALDLGVVKLIFSVMKANPEFKAKIKERRA